VPLEDELYGLVRKSSKYEQLIRYCYDYMMDNSKYKLMPPFIEKDKTFGLKPVNYDQNYALICKKEEDKKTSKKAKNILLENLLDYMNKSTQKKLEV
jgi:hypothetical protein